MKLFATVLTARNAGMWEGIEALETMNLTIDSTIFDADQGRLEPGQKGSGHLLFDALAGLSASSYRLEYTKTPTPSGARLPRCRLLGPSATRCSGVGGQPSNSVRSTRADAMPDARHSHQLRCDPHRHSLVGADRFELNLLGCKAKKATVSGSYWSRIKPCISSVVTLPSLFASTL